MSQQKSRILIAGGGIGGLTAAVALKRDGHSVRVLEAADKFRLVGAGITVQINAMQAMRQIGLAEEVIKAGNVLNRLTIRFSNGKPVTESDMSVPAKKYGVPFVAIHRAKLHEVLLDAVGSSNVTCGFRVEECADDGQRVVVRSQSGNEETGDILIGADGLHSRVREQLWGTAELRYSGYTSWRGIVDNEGRVPADVGGESWGDKSIFGMIPLAGGKLYWFATHQTAAGGKDDDDPRQTILAETGQWHDPISAIVESTPIESIIRTDIRDRPSRFPWGTDRITLLGDAAHPMTPNLGQGGCQAIEDGVILADSIRDTDSLPSGLRAYEQRRRKRTEYIVDSSQSMSSLGHGRTPAMRFARKWLFPNMPEFVRNRLMDRIFEFDGRAR